MWTNDDVIELLQRGFSLPMIARKLGTNTTRVGKIAATPTDEYEPTDRPSQTWKGARAKAARILLRLGLTRIDAARFMGVSRRTIYNYLSTCRSVGTPLIEIRLKKLVYGRQGEHIRPGTYRVLDFGRDVGLVRTDKPEKLAVHFINPYDLHGCFELISHSLFDGGSHGE